MTLILSMPDVATTALAAVPGITSCFFGAGNDTLTGGQSSDVFVVNTFTAGGIDTIADFNPIAFKTSAFFTPPSSRLQFHIGVDPDELDPLTAFASLDTSDADTGATITIAEHTVVFEGVFAADISVGDFIFLSGPMDAGILEKPMLRVPAPNVADVGTHMVFRAGGNIRFRDASFGVHCRNHSLPLRASGMIAVFTRFNWCCWGGLNSGCLYIFQHLNQWFVTV
ncbi:hypothetical protein [Roseovarius sp. TM1035]|uniref:hypothetical protein n=1 Tax=Roseovarius sp. TM1035 TaxID=391613 RepID=UPI0013A6BD17|nr:hypothetical protein [Roseovarius sp. TM1035]